jgi:hypothetical protein
VKSKKYLLPLAVLNPGLTGGVVVAYLVRGRMDLPRDATVFNIGDAEKVPGQSPAEASPSSAPVAGSAAISAKTGDSLH